MKQFKIRCSAIGDIMTNPRNKKDSLSKTTMGYLENWVKENIIYNRIKKSESKYFDKGNLMEEPSLDYIAEHLGYGMLVKNEEYFEDDFITGTPDVILKDHLIDVKNSWDCFTFPLFFWGTPNKGYYWQAQGYMHLTGRDSYKLIYVLMDTPEHLIENEYKYNKNKENESLEEFSEYYKYDKINPKHRIKVFDIKRNQEDIDSIIERVKECRNYVNQLYKQINY
jgi:hypothetical protein